LKAQEGSRRVCHQWLSSPHPPVGLRKNLTGFLRFAWTPQGCSGGSGPPDPPGQLRRCSWTTDVFPSVALDTRLQRFVCTLGRPQKIYREGVESSLTSLLNFYQLVLPSGKLRDPSCGSDSFKQFRKLKQSSSVSTNVTSALSPFTYLFTYSFYIIMFCLCLPM